MDQELPLDSNTFRRLMARLATGVTILAAESTEEGAVIGMTANAVVSVSLDPFLLLICVERRAKIGSLLLKSDAFSLSILGENQLELSDYFAARWEGNPPEFEFTHVDAAPILSGSIGSIQCRQYDILEGGDHWIILGEVVAIDFEYPPPSPLIFFGSQYRRLIEQN